MKTDRAYIDAVLVRMDLVQSKIDEMREAGDTRSQKELVADAITALKVSK